MDLDKLSPAPWKAEPADMITPPLVSVNGITLLLATAGGPIGNSAVEFVALARNAFSVMMQRGWFVRLMPIREWIVYDEFSGPIWDKKNKRHPPKFYDPFTALVEVDKWYKEHVEHA